MNQTRNKAFDGIKGLSILAIISYHIWPNLMSGGFLTVNCFLVLAGYFLAKKIYNYQTTPNIYILKQLLSRSLTRLWKPLFWAILLIVLAIQIFNPILLKSMRTEIFSSLFFANNFFQLANQRSYFTDMAVTFYLTHLWYIAIYFQSFLISLLLLWTGRKLQITNGVLTLFWIFVYLISTTLTFMKFRPWADPSSIYYSPLTRYASFAIGITSFFGQQYLIKLGRNKKNYFNRLNYFILTLLSFTFITSFIFSMEDQETSSYLLGMPYTNLLTAIFILGANQQFIIIEKIIGNPLLSWFGKRSYSLYLNYYPVLVFTSSFVRTFTNQIEWLKLLSFLAVILIGNLFYYVFEAGKIHPLFAPNFSLSKKINILQNSWRFPIKIDSHLITSIIYLLLLISFPMGLLRSQNQIPLALFDLEYGIYSTNPSPFSRYYHLDHKTKTVIKLLDKFDEEFKTSFNQQKIKSSWIDLAFNSYHSDSVYNQIINLSQENQQIINNLRERAPKIAHQLKTQEIIYAHNLPITLFGDSIAKMVGFSMNDLFPKANSFGYVSLSVWYSYDEFQSLLDQGLVQDNLLINLGTNGGLDIPAMEKLIAIAGERQIYLVNSNSDIAFLDQIDQVILELVKKYPNIHRVDWRTVSTNHPEFFREDNIHPSIDGAEYYLAEVARTVFQNRP